MENIPDVNALQIEAAKRYPKGIMITSVVNPDMPAVPSTSNFRVQGGMVFLLLDGSTKRTIYKDGKWAEAKLPDGISMLEFLWSLYTPGTVVEPMNLDGSSKDYGKFTIPDNPQVFQLSVFGGPWHISGVPGLIKVDDRFARILHKAPPKVEITQVVEEVVEDGPMPLPEETLLQKAERLYKPGVTYIPLSISGDVCKGAQYTVQMDDFAACKEGDSIFVATRVGSGYVYVRGKWAEIVEKPLTISSFPETIMDEIKRRFPPGSMVRPISDRGDTPYGSYRVVQFHEILHDANCTYFWHNNSPGFLYYRGKWAQVAEVHNAPPELNKLGIYPVRPQDCFSKRNGYAIGFDPHATESGPSINDSVPTLRRKPVKTLPVPAPIHVPDLKLRKPISKHKTNPR